MSAIPKRKIFEKEIRNKLGAKSYGKMTEETLLLKSFKFYDLPNSGEADPQLFIKALVRIGINLVNEENVHQYFDMYDINKTGFIKYKDFVDSVFGKKPQPDSAEQEQPKPQERPPQDSGKKIPRPKQKHIIANKELLKKIHDGLKERGDGSIISLNRTFKIMDKDKSGKIDKSELKRASRTFGFNLTDEEIDIVFQSFDEDGSGEIDYEEFLRIVRGKMNSFRRGLVAQAFNLLDTNKNGEIELGEIQDKYNVGRHPDLLNGRKTKDEIYQEFIDSFQQHYDLIHEKERDTKITFDEFLDYYESVSMTIDDDAYFETLMNNAWRMNQDFSYAGKKGWSDSGNKNNLGDSFNKRYPSKERDLILDKIRKIIVSKGARGVVGIIKGFKTLDDNKSSGVTIDEFTKVIKESIKEDKNLNVANAVGDDDIKTLFDYLDIQQTGVISYPDFINMLHKGKMNSERRQAISDTFDRIDVEEKGSAELKELKNLYTVPEPNLIPDLIESLEVYHNAVRGNRNPIVTKEDFISFYDVISFLIPSDKTFTKFVDACWGEGIQKLPKLRVNQQELGKQKSHRNNIDFHKKKAPYGVDKNKIKYVTASNPDFPQYPEEIDKVISRFRTKITARGLRGVMGLKRQFMLLDENGNGVIDHDEFEKMLKQMRLNIKEEDVNTIFNYFDKDGSGTIDYKEFSDVILGEVSEFRLKLIEKVFKKLDKENKGYITVEDIRMGYIPEGCPLVRTGKRTAESILGDFIDLIEYHFNLLNDGDKKTDDQGNIIVTFQEFVEFERNISVCVPDDKFYEVMISGTWGLDINGRIPYQRGWDKEEDN